MPAASLVPTTYPASLTKVGTGTVVLDPASATGNAYTGSTNVNAGVLNIQTAHALGYNTSAVEDVHVTGSGGAFQLSFGGTHFTNAINVGASAATVQTRINSDLPNIAVSGGSVFVTQSGNDYFVYFDNPLGAAGSDPLAYVAQPLFGFQTVGNASVAISTLVAGGASTINVAAGGSGPATLQLQNAASNSGNNGSLVEASGKALTLNGPGFNNDGALENVFGTNTWGSAITLGSNTAIGVDDTSSLAINRSIGDGGGGFSLTKDGIGTLNEIGTTSNTYTGTTIVQDGTVKLDKTLAAVAVAGNLQVGDAQGLLQTQTLTFNNFASSQRYQLTFAGQSTGLLTYQGGVAGDATTIAGALNSLPFVTTDFTAGSTPFTVAQIGTTGSFTVTLDSALLNGTTWAPILGFRDPLTAPANASITSSSVTNSTAAIPDTDVVLLQQNNQLAATSNVTVKDTGKFDLGSQLQTIASLTTVGTADVSLTGASSVLTLAGNVAATSDANGYGLIHGPGAISLGGAMRTFSVDGPQNSDLLVSSVIEGTIFSDGVTVTSPLSTGRLELNTVSNTYTGSTTINSGDLQLDNLDSQTITFTGSPTSATSFKLAYTQAGVSGLTNTIIYSATAANTASNIAAALNALLTSARSTSRAPRLPSRRSAPRSSP